MDLSFHQENQIFSSQWQRFIFTKKFGFSYLSRKVTSVQEAQPLSLLLSTMNYASTYLIWKIVLPAYTSFGYGQNFVQKGWDNGNWEHYFLFLIKKLFYIFRNIFWKVIWRDVECAWNECMNIFSGCENMYIHLKLYNTISLKQLKNYNTI